MITINNIVLKRRKIKRNDIETAFANKLNIN